MNYFKLFLCLNFYFLSFFIPFLPSSPHRLSCWRKGQTRLRAFPSSSVTSMPARSENNPVFLLSVDVLFVAGVLTFFEKVCLNMLFMFPTQVIAEAVRTTLGPRGMDKLMVDGRGDRQCWTVNGLQYYLVWNSLIKPFVFSRESRNLQWWSHHLETAGCGSSCSQNPGGHRSLSGCWGE